MNERGATSIILLIFLPFILTAIAVGFAGAMSVHITEKTNMICRQGLLDAESHMLNTMNQLISLNLTARSLRNMDRSAKLTMFIPFYGAITAMSIQETRLIFRSIQQKLIQRANLDMKRELAQISFKINSAFPDIRGHIIQSELLNIPKLSLTASPRFNLTPDYQPSENFKELMLAQIKWRISIHRFLPSWLIRLVGGPEYYPHQFDLNLKCASVPQKELTSKIKPQTSKMRESIWQASLTEKDSAETSTIRAKQLLNLF